MFLTTNELSGDLLRLFSVKWIHRRLFVPLLLPRTPGLFGMFSLDREILSYPSERSELRYNNPVQKVRCFFHISSQGFGFSSSKGCPVYSARCTERQKGVLDLPKLIRAKSVDNMCLF